ncbi:hypothetical protein GSI_03377 [Ganoderma sinense ZZ0214-1]|uniref:Uncharacterized protein n=1 Tax=Ganoderma sinense ZZ0214-1 TaxID=1077348 RepID=A0A2G8SLZ5_9APHY|nr:hypothetical protein GSI_03377 [Ganoderma sinense ZZ0214-1]
MSIFSKEDGFSTNLPNVPRAASRCVIIGKHVVPPICRAEGVCRGVIALIKDENEIVVKWTIKWLINDEEEQCRCAKWVPREFRKKRCVPYRYAHDIAPANVHADTD